MVCLLALGFLVGSAQAQEARWFDLSDFDPFGHALNNVEEAIPGLWLKGIVWQDTGVFLDGKGDQFKSSVMRGVFAIPPPGGYNPNPGFAFGNRHRNWTMEKIEWFTELEARYVPPGMPQLEINSVWDFRYNALYDWDHSFKRNFDIHDPSGRARSNLYPALKEWDEYYNDTKKIWREFFIKWTPPGWIIKLGKQQFVWAKVDTKVHDQVIAFDQRYGAGGAFPRLTQSDYEYVNIPTWMLNVTRQIGTNYYLQLIWNFDYERHDFQRGGFPWQMSIGMPSALDKRLRADMPNWSISDHEVYARFGFMIDGWNGHLFYAYYWNKSLVNFRRRFDIVSTPVGPLPQYTIEPKPTRQHMIGLALDYTFWWWGRNWAVFMESAYDVNLYFGNLMEGVIALGLTNPLLNAYDGNTKRNRYRHVWGIQSYFLQDFSFILYWSNTTIFGRDGGIATPWASRNKTTSNAFFFPALSYNVSATEDRLSFGYVNAIIPFETLSSRQSASVSYTFSNYLKAMVNFYYFWGDSTDTWGLFNDQSYMEVKLKYEF
jgi:hypothetical protein